MATVEMCKFMKPGKVVLVLARCWSGCKVVIMKNIDDGISDDLTVLLWWLELTVTAVGKKKTTKRPKVKSFMKVCNYNHLMPTRYSVDTPLNKTGISKDLFRDPAPKCKAQCEVKVKCEERYKTGKNKWLVPLESVGLDLFFISVIKHPK